MKILICSDGSEPADRAIRLGAAVAGGCQAEATLLGINETAGDNSKLLDSLKRGQALFEDKKIHAELVTKTGNVLAEIIKRTEEVPYDLVVIGAARKEGRGAFWMSSKSYRIIKEIKPAVLSIAGSRTTLKRILVCSGGKHYIDKAVRLTGEIAKCTGAGVSLLHVLPEAPGIYSQLPKMVETPELLLKAKSELALSLRASKETLESFGLTVEIRLRYGVVLDEILREIREGDYDLVVTGSALSQGLRTYVLGDITRELLNRVNRAVLVVRSEDKPTNSPFRLPKWFSKTKVR
jgi:nucleotide-binding universal stress UspA family protein